VVRERPIDLLGQRLTEEHIGETSSQLLRGRLRVAGSKTREGEHPQALMQLVGELQLSPSLCRLIRPMWTRWASGWVSRSKS